MHARSIPRRTGRAVGARADCVAPAPSNIPDIFPIFSVVAPCHGLTRCHRLAKTSETDWIRQVRATSVGLPALAVAGPVREQPRPSHPTAHSPRGGPRGARRKALVTADASAARPGGPVRGHPREAREA